MSGMELIEMKREDFIRAGIPKRIANNILKNLTLQETMKTVTIVMDENDLSTAKTFMFDSQGALSHFLSMKEATSLMDVTSKVSTASIRGLITGHTYVSDTMRETNLRKSINEVIGYQQNDANFFAKKVKINCLAAFIK